MAPLVVADEAQALRHQGHHLVPKPEIGAERIGKDNRAPSRIAVLAPVQPDIAKVKNMHLGLLPATLGRACAKGKNPRAA